MKQPTQQYLDYVNDTITMGAGGANLCFAEVLADLHSVLEGILSQDGYKPQAKVIRIHVRLFSEHNFGVQPVIVQTAGNFVDSVDLASGPIEETINLAVDDVFGYKRLGNFSLARKVPSTLASSNLGKEITIEVPGNILQILNKEVETERLQNLHLGIIGICAAANQVISVNTVTEIQYVTVAKKIVLR